MNKTINMIKWKLRSVMAEKRVSIRDLAKASNFSPTTISKWRDADLLPKIDAVDIDKLCRALGCKDEDLVIVGDEKS